MSFKGPSEMAIIISTINTHMYINILDNFLIESIENWFGDDEVIFQDDNLSCQRAKRNKAFFRKGI